MKKHRKILSLLVSVLMLFNVAFTAFADIDGQSENGNVPEASPELLSLDGPVLLSTSDVDVGVKLYYNGNPNDLYEGVLTGGKSLNVDITITGSQLTLGYKPVFALYSKSSGVLQTMNILEVNESSSSEILYSYTYSVPWSTDDILAKIFVFESFDTIRCLTDIIALSADGEDNFSNDISKARAIPTDVWINGTLGSGDMDWFKFTPTVTGKYGVSITGFEGSHITVTDGADYTDETYGDTVSVTQIQCDFIVGNDYYIKVDAVENEGSYKITATKLVDIQNLTASFDSTTNAITVSGNISAGQGESISLSVYNPEDNLEQFDCVESGENGYFTYSYKTPNPLQGTYQAVVSNYLLDDCAYTTFNNGTASEYVNRKPEITNAPFLMEADTHIQIDGIVDSVDIAGGGTAQANVIITNNNTTSQQVTVGIAFYDEDNYMTDYYGIAKRVEAGTTEEFYPSVDLPSDKVITKIKALIFEGAGLYGGSNVMVAETAEVSDGQIKRYGRGENTETELRLLSSSEPALTFTNEDKNSVIAKMNGRSTESADGDMSVMSYTPWGIQFSQSGSKLEVDASFMSNNYFYERYFDDNTRERFMINVKNKQSHDVYFVYFVNTSYEIDDTNSYSLGGDRYFQIKAERLSANATKTLTLDLAGHSHDDTYFNPGERFGHQVGFGVWEIGTSFLDADFFDVDSVNLFPINRNLFGNSFSNAYGITQPKDEQSSDNTGFSGFMDSDNDVDYCKFKPSVSGSYTFTSSGLANIYGELYNASQSRLTGDNSGGFSKTTFSFTYNLTAGSTYYIKMSHNSGWATGPYLLFITADTSGGGSGGGSTGKLTVQNLRYTAGPKLGGGNQVSFEVKNTKSSTQSFIAVVYAKWSGQPSEEKARTTLKSVGANKTANIDMPEFKMYNEGPGLTTTVEILNSSGTVLTSASRTNTVEDLGGQITPQPVEFKSAEANHKYIFDNQPEFVSVRDTVESGRLLMHKELTEGKYTVFSYQHKATIKMVGEGYVPVGDNFADSAAVYFNSAFYNKEGQSGSVKINKLGYGNANFNGDFQKIWEDFAKIGNPHIDYNYTDEERPITSSDYIWLSQLIGSSADNKMLISNNAEIGHSWLMMEFEVKGGTVNFATMAFTDKGDNSIPNEFDLNDECLLEDEQFHVLKGIGDFSQTRQTDVMEYFIDDSITSGTTLKFNVTNNLYSTVRDGFTTNTSPLYYDTRATTPDSSVARITYDGPRVSDITDRPLVFDAYHSPYLFSHTLPEPVKVGAYSERDLQANERFDPDWCNELVRLNEDYRFQSMSFMIGASTMLGYGITNNYKFKIYNSGNPRTLTFWLSCNPQYDVSWKVNGEYAGRKYIQGSPGTTNVATIELPTTANEPTEITFCVTQMTGNSATARNWFTID